MQQEIHKLKTLLKQEDVSREKLINELNEIKTRQVKELNSIIQQKDSEIFNFKTELTQANRHCVELERELDDMRSDKENIEIITSLPPPSTASSVVTSQEECKYTYIKTNKSIIIIIIVQKDKYDEYKRDD